MRSRLISALAGLALLAAAAPAHSRGFPTPGEPQDRVGKLTLTPYLGVNIPTADLVKLGSGTSQDSTIKIAAGITLGGRLGVALSPRLGFQADVGYSPGSVEYSQTGTAFNQDIRTVTGAAKLVFFLIPRRHPLWASVSGGLGVVRHTFSGGTAASSGLEGGTNVGGVVGGTVGIRAGRAVAVTVSVEDYLYKAKFDVSGSESSLGQNDIRITGGIRFPFLGM